MASAPYEIKIGIGNLSRLAVEVSRFSPTKVFVIYDSNVVAHLQKVTEAFADTDFSVETFEVAAGEASKCLQMATAIWEHLLENRADRKSLIVALGGGVVGDLAGFAAAAFARGIPFFQVPTTLLAQVDSSVGGKTGINLASAKNMVGAFWQPSGVLVDIDTLSTLNDREYISGLAEVIKYGLIMDREFFEKLEDHSAKLVLRDREFLVEVITRCCQLKAQVVLEDEKEISGRRAILNYGHTFAHAFETTFGYGEYLHGEAVAVGMLCAGYLAFRLDRVPLSFCERQLEIMKKVGLPTAVRQAPMDQLLAVMQRDKKNIDSIIRLILPVKIGEVEMITHSVEPQLIEESIQKFMGSLS
ncbi:MAG: 3-dehydroquinate synthase [Planctomycetota bacterium]|nr:3-dehydroquinate synthase [Planctomycetota bacterium]